MEDVKRVETGHVGESRTKHICLTKKRRKNRMEKESCPLAKGQNGNTFQKEGTGYSTWNGESRKGNVTKGS